MARPQKNGLDYFPLDVDIDQDDKMALIEAQHGLMGFAIVIKLLMKIYKNGYYYEWTEKEQLLFSKRVNVDINSINVIINDCIKWGFFNIHLLESFKILTSKGIQRRFIEAVGRRQKVTIDKKHLLLDETTVNVYKNLIIVDINTHSNDINVNINPQRKEKESKEKESKEENKENINSLSLSLCKEVEILTNGQWYLAKDLQQLNALIEMHTHEWVKDAILKAISKGKKSLDYATGILNNWVKNGKEEISHGSTGKNTSTGEGKYTGFKAHKPKIDGEVDSSGLI